MGFLGVDVGSTGVKAALVRMDGLVLGYAYEEYQTKNPAPGHFELDAEEIWAAARRVIKGAAAQGMVDAICISSFGESFVLLDENGCPLGPVLMYSDCRGDAQSRRLSQSIGDTRLVEITGHAPLGMFSLPKLMYWQEHYPGLMEKARHIHFMADYILFKLTGLHVTDETLAARSLAFHIRDKRWDGFVLEKAGVDKSLFPPVHRPGTAIGPIRSDLAAELSVTPGAVLVLGAQDQITSALGAGVILPGQALNGIGTVDCLVPVYQTPPAPADLIASFYNTIAYPVPGTYVSYCSSMTGGALLKWFRDHFAQDVKAEAARTGRSAYAILDESVDPDPTGLFVVPHFAGAPMPRIDAAAKGAILGLSFNTTRGEIYKACMEGEALSMRQNLETLKRLNIPVEEIRAVGGGARSDLFLQIRADVFGQPVRKMKNPEAGTLGVAILAGVALGRYAGIAQACEALVSPGVLIQPDMKKHLYYTERYQTYLSLQDLLAKAR